MAQVLVEDPDNHRRLDDLRQPAARDVTRAAGNAAGDLGIVLAEVFEALLRQLARPRLDVARREVGGDVGRVADLEAELPESGQVRPAVWCFRRRGCEVGLAVGGARDAGRRLFHPLRRGIG